MNADFKQALRGHPGPLFPAATVATPRTPASPEQRRKVAGSLCIVCGRSPVDPAHLVPQRLGGCAAADCVVALCRTHHRLFDTNRLILAPYLGPGLEREMRHALVHVSCAELEAALTEGGWPPPWESESQPAKSTGNGVRS
jgi:hypothetical protein